MATRKQPDWLREALDLGDGSPSEPEEQITIVGMPKRGATGDTASKQPTMNHGLSLISKMTGGAAEYTGTGDDDKVDPSRPTDMIMTQDGEKMLHEGEIKIIAPGNRLVVVPAHDIAKMSGQDILAKIEGESTKMQGGGGMPPVDGFKCGTSKVPGYMMGTPTKVPGYQDGTGYDSTRSLSGFGVKPEDQGTRALSGFVDNGAERDRIAQEKADQERRDQERRENEQEQEAQAEQDRQRQAQAAQEQKSYEQSQVTPPAASVIEEKTEWKPTQQGVSTSVTVKRDPLVDNPPAEAVAPPPPPVQPPTEAAESKPNVAGASQSVSILPGSAPDGTALPAESVVATPTTTPPPSGNQALVDEALGNMANVMRGESPVDQMIMNRYLSAMRAGDAMERKKLAQQASVDPDLSDGAKRAAGSELRLMQDIAEGELMSDLSQNAMQRAEDASSQVFTNAQVAEKFTRELADEDWARSLSMYDPANPGELKVLQDMYVAKFGGPAPSLAVLQEERNFAQTMRSQAVTKGEQSITMGDLGITGTQWDQVMQMVDDNADIGQINSMLTQFGGTPISDAQFASMQTDRMYKTDMQDVTLEAADIQTDAAGYSLVQTMLNDGASIESVNEARAKRGERPLTVAEYDSMKSASATGKWGAEFALKREAYADDQNWKAYEKALAVNEFKAAAKAYEAATGTAITTDEMKKDRENYLSGQEMTIEGMRGKLDDAEFERIGIRVDSGVPYKDENGNINPEFIGENGEPIISENEYAGMRDASPLGDRDWTRQANRLAFLLEEGGEANIAKAKEGFTEMYPGMTVDFTNRITDETALGFSTTIKEMTLEYGNYKEFGDVLESVRKNWADTTGLSDTELKQMFEGTKLNAIDEQWSTISDSIWFDNLDPKEQAITTKMFQYALDGEVAVDAVAKYPVLDADKNEVTSFPTKAKADAYVASNGGEVGALDYDLEFKDKSDGTTVNVDVANNTDASSTSAGTSTTPPKAGTIGSKSGEYYVGDDGIAYRNVNNKPEPVHPDDVDDALADNKYDPNMIGIASSGPGGEMYVKGLPEGTTIQKIDLGRWGIFENGQMVSSQSTLEKVAESIPGASIAITPDNPYYDRVSKRVVSASSSNPGSVISADNGIIGLPSTNPIYQDVLRGKPFVSAESFAGKDQYMQLDNGNHKNDMYVPWKGITANTLVNVGGKLVYIEKMKRDSRKGAPDYSTWTAVDVESGDRYELEGGEGGDGKNKPSWKVIGTIAGATAGVLAAGAVTIMTAGAGATFAPALISGGMAAGATVGGGAAAGLGLGAIIDKVTE